MHFRAQRRPTKKQNGKYMRVELSLNPAYPYSKQSVTRPGPLPSALTWDDSNSVALPRPFSARLLPHACSLPALLAARPRGWEGGRSTGTAAQRADFCAFQGCAAATRQLLQPNHSILQHVVRPQLAWYYFFRLCAPPDALIISHVCVATGIRPTGLSEVLR